MHVEVRLISDPIPTNPALPLAEGKVGAMAEFRGIVRGEEGGAPIAALEYEAYPAMAVLQMETILRDLGSRHTCEAARVIHRVGIIPVNEMAIWIGVTSAHRQEALAVMTAFLERLKQDVPIWKVRAVPPSAATRLVERE